MTNREGRRRRHRRHKLMTKLGKGCWILADAEKFVRWLRKEAIRPGSKAGALYRYSAAMDWDDPQRRELSRLLGHMYDKRTKEGWLQ